MNARIILLLSAAAVVVGFGICADSASKEEDPAVFAAKAKELTTGKTSRLEKIAALHAFVRDQIAEVPTNYG